MRSTATLEEQIRDIYSETNSYPNSSTMSPTATQSVLYPPIITETVQTKPFPIRGNSMIFSCIIFASNFIAHLKEKSV